MTADASRRLLFLLAAPSAALLLASAASGARVSGSAVAATPPATPVLAAPAEGAVVEAMPSFAWAAAARAERYEFQLAADAGFNAPVWSGTNGEDRFITRNTRATVKRPAPNGTYYWRVRAIDKAGAVSPWTPPRSLKKLWSAAPTLQSPAHGAAVSYPETPLTLRWSVVRHAARYDVNIATDPAMAAVVSDVDTRAENHTPQKLLAPGTYYWNVTPVDARGNRGLPSSVAAFTIVWPTTTSPRVTDLSETAEVFDPSFGWDAIAGAVRYEVEVNSAQDFAPGSKVCCTGTSIGTSLSPTVTLKDNVYYWRVRALDADGNAGVWNEGPAFTKAFDKVPPVVGTSVKNLRMRSVGSIGSDVDVILGYQTRTPILAWDAVPGAASYQVDVAPYLASCQWNDPTRWSVVTSTTWWTPQAGSWNSVKPYPDATMVAYDAAKLLSSGQSYCARVRARSDRDTFSGDVYGDYTYLNDGTGASFTFAGFEPGGTCSPSCSFGYLGGSDYLEPIASGGVNRITPMFTWRPLSRKGWKTLKNTSGADAITVIAKTEGTASLNYRLTTQDNSGNSAQDQLVLLNGAVVLQTWTYADGDLAALEALVDASVYVEATVLADGTALATVTSSPFFPGITSYYVLVAKDASFSNIVDYALTNVSAYAPRSLVKPTSYSDETTLYYWAILPASGANGSNAAGDPLSAAPTSFQKDSLAPTPAAPGSGADITEQPTFRWSLATGARRYRLQVAQDPSFATLVDDILTASSAYTSVITYPADVALWWRVRADDENLIGLNWSTVGTFRKRLAAPVFDPSNPASGELIPTWRWSPVQGATSYDVLANYPDGKDELVTGLRATAITATYLTGQGIWTIRVRANFAKSTQAGGTTTPGPWSTPIQFTRMLGEPSGAQATVSANHVLFSWEPKAEAHHYRIQVSSTADFALRTEDVTTENTSYAPLLEHFAYRTGGNFYWRVAAVDEHNNQGDYSPAQKFTLAGKSSSAQTKGRLLISASRLPRRGRLTTVTMRVISSRGKTVSGAAVRLTGAGIRPQARRTNRAGKVVFRVKPRKRGTIVVRAVKTTFTAGVLRLRIV